MQFGLNINNCLLEIVDSLKVRFRLNWVHRRAPFCGKTQKGREEVRKERIKREDGGFALLVTWYPVRGCSTLRRGGGLVIRRKTIHRCIQRSSCPGHTSSLLLAAAGTSRRS